MMPPPREIWPLGYPPPPPPLDQFYGAETWRIQQNIHESMLARSTRVSAISLCKDRVPPIAHLWKMKKQEVKQPQSQSAQKHSQVLHVQ